MALEVKETEKEDKQWTDDADIVKHLTEIHSKKTSLSEDFVLFQGTEEQKEFIRNQLILADRVNDFIIEKTIAKETAQSLIRECQSLAILERNKPANWFVEHLIKRDIGEDIEAQKGKIEQAMDKILGEKKT